MALKPTYAVVFMDGMVFKVKKDGVIQKCTACACIGVDLDGQKEVLSLHIGGAESAKYWVSVDERSQNSRSKGRFDLLQGQSYWDFRDYRGMLSTIGSSKVYCTSDPKFGKTRELQILKGSLR